MFKIFFWNLRHLAEGSPAPKQDAVFLTEEARRAHLSLFCEVMPNWEGLPFRAQNFNYRHRSGQQLCYAAARRGPDGLQTQLLVEHHPGQAPQEYVDDGHKGGTSAHAWTTLVDRMLVHAGSLPVTDPPVDVYLLHAPASRKAVRVLQWVTHALDKIGPTWLLVGDLNASPASAGGSVAGHIASSGFATHHSAACRATAGPCGDRCSELDYAVAGLAGIARVERKRPSSGQHNSDHDPIMVTVTPPDASRRRVATGGPPPAGPP